MVIARSVVGLLLQAAARTDTIIARTIPERGWLEWTNGILQLVVLILAVVAVIALVLVLFAARAGIRKLTATIDSLAAQATPMLTSANAMVTDARSMVAMVRGDVERVTDAAGAISDQLLDAAEVTAQRVDEVNAVLDVLQEELESTVLTTAAAIRGVSVGARALATGVVGGRASSRRRRRAEIERADVPRPDSARSSDHPDDERAGPDVGAG